MRILTSQIPRLYDSFISLDESTSLPEDTLPMLLEENSHPTFDFRLPSGLNRTEVIFDGIPLYYIATALLILAQIKDVTDFKNEADRRSDGNSYARIRNQDLRDYFSNLSGDTTKLTKRMSQAGWIEIDPSYKVGHKAKGFRIGPRFRAVEWIPLEWKAALAIHWPELTEKNPHSKQVKGVHAMFGKARLYQHDWRDMEEGVLKEICQVTENILHGLTIGDESGLTNAIKICADDAQAASLSDGETSIEWKVKAWEDSLERMRRKDFYVSCHDNRRLNFTERISTPWTNMKKEFRPFFLLSGKPLVSVDVRTCQPALLSSFYSVTHPDDQREKDKYKNMILTTDLYSFFATAINETYPGMTLDRSAAKVAMLTLMFARTGHQNKKFYAVFKREFPILARRLEERKFPNFKDVARKMQLMESKVMVRGVLKELLLDKGIVCLSIHDSISCFEEDIEIVKETICGCFENEMGFRPQLKVELASVAPEPASACNQLALVA